ncbi:MAG: sodium:solute symporter [Flammeovirgaceae bacterium]
MSNLDWIVLVGVQLFIVAYGIWKGRGSKDIRAYLLSNKEMKWSTIGLSIMATQASAITFLSTPGQGYGDGMRFVQFYLGLPIAMVIISMVIVPIYHKLNVYTAYEYLESRFDLRMRSLTAFLFLVQRSLAAGFSIYAPAIILSKVLGWPVDTLSIIIGLIVISYTVSGGTKAVSHTQKQQMVVILIGMGIATYMIIRLLPDDIGLSEATVIAGKMGRLNAIDFEFDLNSRYNIWSGLIGGFFVMMAYFGTDQSQVQRYLGGRSVAESKLGLLMNGMIKIPMQFMILFVGALLFVFYMYNDSPLHFNTAERKAAVEAGHGAQLESLEGDLQGVFKQKREKTDLLVAAHRTQDQALLDQTQAELKGLLKEETEIRKNAIKVIRQHDLSEALAGVEQEELAEKQEKILDTYQTKERDYVFITFVTQHLPEGIVGLLIAVILAAAMSSASSELNALATTTVVDIYKRNIKADGSDKHYLNAAKWLTLMWGCFAILFTQFADKLDNLIQAVNIIGSLAYGVILGIFLVAFFLKKVQGLATFIAALMSQALVLYCWLYTDIPFLWYNVIGCIPLMVFAAIIQSILNNSKQV